MTLALNKERLVLLYDFLSECPPFDKWNMPDSDDVIFKVTRSKDTSGYHKQWHIGRKKDKHEIGISAYCCGWMNKLVWVMAHEMLHLHQAEVDMESPHTMHNAAFIKLGKMICKIHGYDPHEFNP
jgi:hypothetical protein